MWYTTLGQCLTAESAIEFLDIILGPSSETPYVGLNDVIQRDSVVTPTVGRPSAIRNSLYQEATPTWTVSFLWTNGHRYSDATGRGSITPHSSTDAAVLSVQKICARSLHSPYINFIFGLPLLNHRQLSEVCNKNYIWFYYVWEALAWSNYCRSLPKNK